MKTIYLVCLASALFFLAGSVTRHALLFSSVLNYRYLDTADRVAKSWTLNYDIAFSDLDTPTIHAGSDLGCDFLIEYQSKSGCASRVNILLWFKDGVIFEQHGLKE